MTRLKVLSHISDFYYANRDEVVRDLSSLGGILLPALIVLFFWGISLTSSFIILGIITIGFFSNLIKLLYKKERPSPQPYKNKVEQINSRSFPSTHVARATFLFSIIAQMTGNQAVYTLIVLVALSRVLLRKHDWIDVLGGLLLGFLGYLLFDIARVP